MQLYHHPFSLDSQRVRFALEEKGIDYTSFHVNPVTGKNMDASFFRMNPTAKLPVFQNGGHVIFDTIEIIQYLEKIAKVSSGDENIPLSSSEVIEWMHKIQKWNPKFFTLCHIPEKHRRYVSKFLRQVLIARMAETPDLAADYHKKLKEAYETEEKLKNPDVLKQDKEHLVRLLDEVETQLNVILNLEDEYIGGRPNMAKYWIMVQQRPSYKKVIGKHFCGWRKHKTFVKTWCIVHIRTMLRKF
ncbi:PREDICTED: glutathione S-transferase TCHQD [Prunus mume]|uniref:Glutathione S-transferase TCHQD n=1 Tax=Prunus mume TaxID=102107 RepID=A0ABM0N577_PRUMU|nr:PREDICTED: glutathione S-transferase TCHQD [Prunus mume]